MSDDDAPSDLDAPADLDSMVKRVDPDRWLSSRLIADPSARADVIAVYAFDYEIGRAPKVASNPLMGEIRLTWWREVLDEAFENRHVRHHPTAEGLAAAIRGRNLPRAPLDEMIDARYRELDAEPMNLADALQWARGTGGATAEVAARVLDPKADVAKARAGGEAWAIGRLMGTAGMTGEGAQAALAKALADAKGLDVAAFPAVAHATLARDRAKGRMTSEFAARAKLLVASLTGRV